MLRQIVKFQIAAQQRVARAMDRRERGATAVEYGLMVALIAAVIIAVVVTLGKQINGAFTSVSDKLPTAPSTTTAP